MWDLWVVNHPLVGAYIQLGDKRHRFLRCQCNFYHLLFNNAFICSSCLLLLSLKTVLRYSIPCDNFNQSTEMPFAYAAEQGIFISTYRLPKIIHIEMRKRNGVFEISLYFW